MCINLLREFDLESSLGGATQIMNNSEAQPYCHFTITARVARSRCVLGVNKRVDAL